MREDEAMKYITGVCFAILFALPSVTLAAPIVTFTTSGSAGNYILDFSVENTLGVGNLDLYFFGVRTTGTVSGAPTAWSAYGTYDPSVYEGGPAVDFNNTWLNHGVDNGAMVQNGETLGGFRVSVSSLPLSVQWFAFGYDWAHQLNPAQYGGGDSFNTALNPGFTGTASAVPEPSSLLLLGSGLLGAALCNRRRKAAAGPRA
jgi:hypothetical protein